MLKRALPAVAVIADAHFHDLEADFGFDRVEVEGRKITMRSWAETRKSTRVFNESADAFLAALAEVRRRGIRHVVLLGDYTDDGQRATTGALRNILDEHSAFGMSFYALPGNHDIFGPQGRHHTKQFLDCAGRGILVTSDVKRAGSGVTVSDRMYCEGYPAGLDPMAGFGYFRKPEYLHWETPFGMSDAAEDREYEVASPDGRNRYNMMDASYLVEPEPGLWLLMIDANVFEPVTGVYEWGDEAAFIDSTSGGWNAMLRCKPFVIPWIADVCARAERLGKTLLAFSHYPVLDSFDGATGAEGALFGETNIARRTPRRAVERALLAAGLSLHFSGHLHVEGVTRRGSGGQSLTNVAVPSLVAFPPAFKIAHPGEGNVAVETVELSGLPVHPRLRNAYEREAALLGEEPDDAFSAPSYGAFLRAHKRALVSHRYFPEEWPRAIVERVADLTLEEIACLFTGESAGSAPKLSALGQASAIDIAELGRLPMIELVADWYCLRQGASLALAHIEESRLPLYRFLADRFGCEPQTCHDSPAKGFVAIFLGALGLFLERAGNSQAHIVVPSNPARQDASA